MAAIPQMAVGDVDDSDRPSNGDVLISREGGRYLLSIIPHPHKLTLASMLPALEIARKWAAANNVTAWQTLDGVTSKLPTNKATNVAGIEEPRT
jgi:hypothetical protein